MSTTPPGGEDPRTISPPRPFEAGRLFRLARKELTEILRDRRTIMTLVVMPLVLYPLLTIGFGQFVFTGNVARRTAVYRVGFPDADKDWLSPYLTAGMPPPGAGQPELWAGPVDDIDGDLREGRIDVGIRPRAGGAGPQGPREWELVYREDHTYALDVVRYLERVMAAADASQLRAELKRGGGAVPPARRFVRAPIAAERQSGLSVAVFVPLVLILMTMTGAVYPAIDLTAGERERGTLEVLIAAPVPRVSLLFGKYVAVVTVAVLTALVNLTSMTVSLLISGLSEQVFGPGGLRVLTLLEIFALVLLFAAFFSAVLLVLTSFARSFKEAQAYLIPLMVVSLLPGLVGLWPGLPLSGGLAVVPLLNIVLLARDLLNERADPVNAVVVVIATLTYAVLAIAVAAQVFGAEGVLYGESGGWRTLLKRRG
jgi:ABC-2 type transport system permease protein/sodium transport system permease protein